MIEISDAAKDYLKELLAKQEEGCGIRVFVAQPGTPNAETCIAYCRPGEEQDDDVVVDMDGFQGYFEKRSEPYLLDAVVDFQDFERSEPYLLDAVVDFQEDRLGGQLTIRAPNARTPNVTPDSPLEDRINYVLYNEINPGLAAHGGMVTLVEVVQGDTAVLQFGGGCQGCAAVDITLKQGVEKSLIDQIPELAAIRDATDHSFAENAYYR